MTAIPPSTGAATVSFNRRATSKIMLLSPGRPIPLAQRRRSRRCPSVSGIRALYIVLHPPVGPLLHRLDPQLLHLLVERVPVDPQEIRGFGLHAAAFGEGAVD